MPTKSDKKKKNLIDTINAFFAGLSSKEKRLVYIAVIFIVIAFFDRAILGKLNQKLELVENQIAKKKALVTDQIRLLSYKKRILREYEYYDKYFSKVKRTKDEELTIFLKEIEKLGNESPITIVNVSPQGDPEDDNGSTVYTVRLECAGTMDIVANFLYKLENLSRPIKIKNLELSRPKPKSLEVRAVAIVLMKAISLSENISFVE